MLAQSLPALGIGNRQRRAGIGQAILKLRPCPPGIQRRDDGARMDGGPERHRPLRQIAHDDGNPVPLFHSVGNQLFGQLRHRPPVCIKGHPLIVVDHVDAFWKRPARFEHGHQ